VDHLGFQAPTCPAYPPTGPQQIVNLPQLDIQKQGEGKFALSSMNLSILLGIKRNCLRHGRSRSFYQFLRKVIKQIAVIIEAYHFVNYIHNFIQHTAFKVNCTCRGNYWGSSQWFSTQQVNNLSYILHLSNT